MPSDTMRAVAVRNGTGPASALYIDSSVPKPSPGPTEALVKIKCFGLNRMDLLQREGHYPLPPGASTILGVEFSGVIESFGGAEAQTESGRKEKADEKWEVGEEVFGLAYGGAYAEYIAVSTRMLMRKPHVDDKLSWEQCAGISESWCTATQALYLVGGFEPGKSVLWHAGASGVSLAGVQLSKVGEASAVYVTAGSKEKIDFCVNEVGATKGFNYKEEDWVKGVLEATGGKGVDIVVDFVGATYFQGNLNVAGMNGRIVHLGMLGGTTLPEGVNIAPFIAKRLRFEGSTLRSRDTDYQGKLRDTLVEHAAPKMRKGEFKVFVEKVFPWEEIVQAHEFMESNKSKGKIICKIY